MNSTVMVWVLGSEIQIHPKTFNNPVFEWFEFQMVNEFLKFCPFPDDIQIMAWIPDPENIWNLDKSLEFDTTRKQH